MSSEEAKKGNALLNIQITTPWGKHVSANEFSTQPLELALSAGAAVGGAYFAFQKFKQKRVVTGLVGCVFAYLGAATVVKKVRENVNSNKPRP